MDTTHTKCLQLMLLLLRQCLRGKLAWNSLCRHHVGLKLTWNPVLLEEGWAELCCTIWTCLSVTDCQETTTFLFSTLLTDRRLKRCLHWASACHTSMRLWAEVQHANKSSLLWLMSNPKPGRLGRWRQAVLGTHCRARLWTRGSARNNVERELEKWLAPQSRALIVLEEDPSLVLAPTSVRQLTTPCNSSSRWSQAIFWPLQSLHTHSTHIHKCTHFNYVKIHS